MMLQINTIHCLEHKWNSGLGWQVDDVDFFLMLPGSKTSDRYLLAKFTDETNTASKLDPIEILRSVLYFLYCEMRKKKQCFVKSVV